jgi:DNA-binding transcriptional ArsR family regulator
MRDSKYMARILKVLSVEARLKILNMLTDHPCCVCRIASSLGITEGAVSQHMRVLRDTGLVEDVRSGYYVHYGLKKERVEQILSQIHEYLAAVIGNKK